MARPRVVTIGVYGFEEHEFFQALLDRNVDTFCDLRQRRGVRGSQYAFANSQRLQTRLAEMGIRYVHVKELAPDKSLRGVQYAVDKDQGIAKRQRTALSEQFIAAYRRAHLSEFSSHQFMDDLPDDARVIALFCVEREPEACHRSLVADTLARELGLAVEHVR